MSLVVDTDARRAARLAELRKMSIKGVPLGPQSLQVTETLADLVREKRAVTFLVVEDAMGMRELQPRFTGDWWKLLTQPTRAAGRTRVIEFLDEVDADEDLRRLVRDSDIDLDFLREGLVYDA